MFMEHQYNIDNLVRWGSGIRISKRYFKSQELLKAIGKIFDNYEDYQKNAQRLASELTQEPGEEKAVKRIIEILQSNQKN